MFWQKKKTYPRKGFTLVEAIVYIVILSLLFGLSIDATVTMFKAFAGMESSRDLAESGGVAADRMIREIRSATSVDVAGSTLGVNPGSLKLNTTTTSGSATTVEFFLDGSNKLHVKEGGVDEGPLVLSHVTVSRLVFTNINTSGVPLVRFELELTSTRQGQSQTRSFTGAAILRNTYD